MEEGELRGYSSLDLRYGGIDEIWYYTTYM